MWQKSGGRKAGNSLAPGIRSGVDIHLPASISTRNGVSCGGGLDFLADGSALFAFGTHEFVIELEVHPHARGDSEEVAEAEVVFGGAAALALLHLGEVGGGDSAAAGDLGLGQAGFPEGFAEGLGEEVEQWDLGGFRFHV